MSVRVGIDLVSTETIREALDAHGEHYLTRIYGGQELADCRCRGGLDLGQLAACFAAKEAVFKVLPVGDRAVSWRDIEVRRDAGRPRLSLRGGAATMAAEAEIREMSLSLTHDRDCAAAIVIAEIPKNADIDADE